MIHTLHSATHDRQHASVIIIVRSSPPTSSSGGTVDSPSRDVFLGVQDQLNDLPTPRPSVSNKKDGREHGRAGARRDNKGDKESERRCCC